MRKWIIGSLLTLILLMLLTLSASAESYIFDNLYASVDVPDTYVVLTPDNAGSYGDWLEARGTTSEETVNDMLARGVLLQCWNSDGDACVELTATQDDDTLNIYDINEQSNTVRAQYRLSYYPNNDFVNEGYDFSSANWKKTDEGRFLILKYVYRENGQIDHRGLMRRTIRNGYEITFDMQVYGRSTTNKDNTNLNEIWDTFHFVEVQPLPAAASAKINITDAPPTETNSADITLAGTAAEGVTFTTVVMGLSYPTPSVTTVDVGSSGKFKIELELPKEGAFVVTVKADYNDEDVMDLAYPVTYQKTLLIVNVSTTMPDTLTSDELTIQGTATSGSSMQVFLNDETVYKKKIPANGKFKFTIDTSDEGVYTLVMAFTKSGLADRRLSYTLNRQWSEEDMLKSLKSQAIKPSYKTLVNKIDGYDGHIMGYKCYVVSVVQTGDQWVLKMALSKKSSGYENIIYVTTDSDPEVAVDSHVMMYGQCVGMSSPVSEDASADSSETIESYPTFDLLLITSL
jgi:hypothetical protein